MTPLSENKKGLNSHVVGRINHVPCLTDGERNIWHPGTYVVSAVRVTRIVNCILNIKYDHTNLSPHLQAAIERGNEFHWGVQALCNNEMFYPKPHLKTQITEFIVKWKLFMMKEISSLTNPSSKVLVNTEGVRNFLQDGSAEKRVMGAIHGFLVAGTVDFFSPNTETLFEWKTSSTVTPEKTKAWKMQTTIYAILLMLLGGYKKIHVVIYNPAIDKALRFDVKNSEISADFLLAIKTACMVLIDE